MTRSVVVDLAGRSVALRQPLAALFAIDEECGKSAWAVLHDIVTGQARIEQIDAVLHHGLIGGGLALVDADAITRKIRDAGQPLHHYVGIAAQALLSALDVPDTARKGDGEGDPFNRVTAYRSGLAMGMRPADVDAMMLRDFLAAVTAFSSKAGGMSEAERDELWEWIRAIKSPTNNVTHHAKAECEVGVKLDQF